MSTLPICSSGCNSGPDCHKPYSLNSTLGFQVATQALTVTNSSAAPAEVTWVCSEKALAVVPSTAVLQPGSQTTLEVRIRGQSVGQLHAQATCSVQHGSSCVVEVSAQVQGKKSTVCIKHVAGTPLACPGPAITYGYRRKLFLFLFSHQACLLSSSPRMLTDPPLTSGMNILTCLRRIKVSKQKRYQGVYMHRLTVSIFVKVFSS